MNQPTSARGHTTVVYFHGMGQQRRLEETSRLIERLDQFIFLRHEAGDERFPSLHLRDVVPRSEQDRVDPKAGLFTYVNARYGDPRAEEPPAEVRFYEAYWAPKTVEGTSTRRVLAWVGRQVTRPLRMLATRWRALERLRRADLVRYYRQKYPRGGDRETRGTLSRLIQHFHDFFRMDARRDFPKGSFSEFIDFVRREEGGSKQADEMESFARGWRRSHRQRELISLGLILTLGVGVAAFLILLGILVYEALSWIQPWLPRGIELPDKLTPSWSNVPGIVATLLGALGVQRFLKTYLGDVQQFAAYEEVDVFHQRRRSILDQACRVMRHALADPACERVVVVAHSLGCAVALDTLLDLRRLNEADPKFAGDSMQGVVALEKIRHFITLASPIDKISYFFSVRQSKFHRYERIVDELRGDLGRPPFSKSGRQPHIHWINFWDLGDVISGPVESITPSLVRKQEVDNVRLAMFRMPDPGASHSSYFEDSRVLGGIFEAVLQNRHAFAVRGRGVEPDWWGPGGGDRFQNLGLALLLLLPWMAMGTVLEILEILPTGSWFSWLTLANFLLVVAGVVRHKWTPRLS